MTEERRVQLVAEVDTTRTRAGFNEIGQQAGTMAQQVTQAGERAERAVSNVGTGAATTSRNVDAAQRNIIAAIQRTTTAMEAGGRTTAAYYELLARQRGVDPSVLAPYITQLRAVEQAQARTAASAGASAGQIAAAMRTVPAQFTDIVTALQGGQRPLTVLLQQGGQLRDQFGSTGVAARALGGYVLGLVNPYTLAAGAVGVLALAYKSGADEAEALKRALILSGNAAGATSSQLEDMRRNVAAISGSRDAANALAQLVQTAQVPADSLQKFAVLAVDAQRVLGRSVEETVGEFEKLGKSPLQALNAIDDKYHFISASTYAQVKALQDQGKATEAANVAQQAYAAGVQEQKDKVLATLNSWEKAWLGLKMYAADAANAVVDFAGGREASNMEKINALLDERTKLEEKQQSAKKRRLTSVVFEYQAELDANKRAINAIRDRTDAEKARAKAKADAQKVDDARKQWMKGGEQYLTRQTQLERDVTKARNEGAAAGLSSTEIEKRVSDIRKSYADIFNAGIDSNIAAMKRRDQVADVIEQREIARIAAARAAGGMTDEEAINATAKAELEAFDRKRTLLEAEIELTKKKANSVTAVAELEGQKAVLAEQRRNRELQQENDLLALQRKRAQATEELYTKGIVSATAERDSLLTQVEAQFQYNQEIGLSKTQLAGLKAARLDNAAALKDETAAALEALDPANALAAKYREQAQALRDLGDAMVRGADKEQRVDQWKQAVDQYGQVFQQGFADMLNNGNAGWQSFTKSLVTTFKTSVADQIYKMFARPIIVQLVGSYLGVSQAAIAGEIASQPNAYGVTSGSGPIGAAQAASSLYKAVDNGFAGINTTIAGGISQLGSLLGSSNVSAFGAGFGLTSEQAANAAAAYNGAGMAETGSAISAGSSYASSASTAGAYAAGIAIGRELGNSISGKYGVTSNNRAFVNWNTLLSPWAIGGGLMGGLINRAFGMGDKEVTSRGIDGTLTANSLTGEGYTKWHQDGGWFRSDKDGTDTTALTEAIVAQFTSALKSLETASSGFASSLGVSADWVATYSKTFDIALTGDAAKDQQAVTDFFNGIGDEIANRLVPNLADFTKTGETAAAALERLANDFKGTDRVAQLLGTSASSLFGAAGIASAATREHLIDLAGGLSALNSEASFFNQNFLTDAERLKPVAEALDTALASLGLNTIPKTRDEFKALIGSLIDSGAAATDAGAKQLSSLLALAEAFAQVHPAVDATAEAANAVAEAAAAAAKRAEEVAAALQAVKDSASMLLGGVDNAFSALQKVVAREKTAVQASVTVHTAAVTKLQNLSEALHSTLDSFKSPDQKAAERASAQAQIRAALAIAKAGGALPTADSLKQALSAVTADASDQFSSYTDYLRDLYRTQNDIAQLAGITDNSLSVEQKSLDALQAQLTRLDDMVEQGQAQIDMLKGQSVATLTLAQAMGGLATAIGGAKANPIVGATSGIAAAYQQLLGRAPDQAGLDYWQTAIAGGTTLDAIRDAIMKSDEYKHLHPFAIGTNSVPEDMPAFIHKGERIIPAADNRALMARLASPQVDTAALVTEVQALRETVARQQAALDRIANNTREHKEMFENATGGGGPLLVEMA